MKNVKTLTLIAAAVAAMTTGTVQAEQYYGFANVSVNYLDWSDGTEDRSRDIQNGFGAKSDFVYIEVEGGAGYNWGDVYGFIDFENPNNLNWSEDQDDPSKQFRIAAKGSVAVNMGESNWNYYGHIYSLSDSSGFYEQNIVLGVSYDINTDFGLWVKPFLGAHILNNPNNAGFNGGMAGWVLGYNFKLAGQDFMVTNWNEIEFARDDHARGFCNSVTCTGLGDAGWQKTNGDSTGINGAVALWWNATKDFTLGVQYRYADQKLGTAAYQNAAIFTAKYNF
ncbi:ion channel protein Tsx [Shewanella sp. ULN5]|uniref:outer membrane protein OmpK n=1 Tax=Shewanella sp. ULN5 TaxID=2994678 RepID=UPI00273EC386|nr:outer membrane protein OmpK [Shewanella sp. ULN5]MDP5146128.1 ion channel protein Tsx [Shewanella sp. ULN5]